MDIGHVPEVSYTIISFPEMNDLRNMNVQKTSSGSKIFGGYLFSHF